MGREPPRYDDDVVMEEHPGQQRDSSATSSADQHNEPKSRSMLELEKDPRVI